MKTGTSLPLPSASTSGPNARAITGWNIAGMVAPSSQVMSFSVSGNCTSGGPSLVANRSGRTAAPAIHRQDSQAAGSARGLALFTSRTAARRISSVMVFIRPSWSSAPKSPQFGPQARVSDGCRNLARWNDLPPSAASAMPVTWDDSALVRNGAAWAISIGWATLQRILLHEGRQDGLL